MRTLLARPSPPPGRAEPHPRAGAADETGAGRGIRRYHAELAQSPRSLVGYVMELGYDAGVIVTNDFYKVRAGGLSKNSFLLIRPGSLRDLIRPDDESVDESAEEPAAGPEGGAFPEAGEPDNLFDLLGRRPEARGGPGDSSGPADLPPHLILARVLEPAATPLAQDVARTYFEMRKSQAPEIDVFTRGELQWAAMKVAILGTFYDRPGAADSDAAGDGTAEDGTAGGIEFGGDIQNFLSPHLYSVHVPPRAMLEGLVNAFVDVPTRRAIGAVRLSESLLTAPRETVAVFVSPGDFIGSRTALFGKTRTGKSNTVKVIAQMVLDSVADSGAKVGQIIFDLNGEYAYRNEQDRTCLFDLYRERCVRYSLRPKPPAGVRPLKADFYGDLELGHRIVRELFRQQEGAPPDYMKGFLEWEPLAAADVKAMEKEDHDASTRYERQESMYRCVLHEAGFEHAPHVTVKLHLNQDVRAALAQHLAPLAQADADGVSRLPAIVPLDAAAAAFQTLWHTYDPALPLFRSQSGREYLDETAKSMLTILAKCRLGGGGFVSGYSKLVPFKRYHARDGRRLLREIVEAVDASRTVIIDLSNAAEELVEFFGGLVCAAVFRRQMEKFTSDTLADHHVQFYFEEAHNLFPRDDRNLRGIYNRLAKEGAKLNIGLIYSTQSIESLSPDLLKNTENFFIAHLNDEREIKALTRFHEFRDVGADVQRAKTRGFVRMITRSHRFALPVQVRKFGPGGGEESAEF